MAPARVTSSAAIEAVNEDSGQGSRLETPVRAFGAHVVAIVREREMSCHQSKVWATMLRAFNYMLTLK